MEDTELDTYVGGAVYYRGPIGFLAEMLDEGGVDIKATKRSIRFPDYPSVKIVYVGKIEEGTLKADLRNSEKIFF